MVAAKYLADADPLVLRVLVMSFLFSVLVCGANPSCVDVVVTETVWVIATSSTIPIKSPTPISGIPSQTGVGGSSSSSSIVPSATYNPMPVPAARIFKAPANFNHLTATPNTGSIRNSCKYDVFVWSVGCNGNAANVKISPGTTWSEPLRRGDTGGVVYKVSKTNGNAEAVMQFEAGVWKDQNIVQYDLSYLDCMVPNSTDLSRCAGWEGGHQAVPAPGCPVFVCGTNEYCDGSSYTVPEFGYQGGGVVHPNAGCGSAGGIAFELCACSGEA